MNGDGVAEIITGTTRRAGPSASSRSGTGRVAEVASFFLIPAFQGPVRVAAADVNGDGVRTSSPGQDPVAARMWSSGSRRRWPDDSRQLLRVSRRLLRHRHHHSRSHVLRRRVRCAGDITGDGLAEVITGTNRRGGPVRVFQIGAGVIELTSFYPYLERLEVRFASRRRCPTTVRREAASRDLAAPGSSR